MAPHNPQPVMFLANHPRTTVLIHLEQWEVPASWQQHQPPAQHQPIHTLPLNSHSQQQQLPPAPHQQHGPTFGGLVNGALHSASDVLKDKVSHAGVVLKDKIVHAGIALANASAFETAVDDNECPPPPHAVNCNCWLVL